MRRKLLIVGLAAAGSLGGCGPESQPSEDGLEERSAIVPTAAAARPSPAPDPAPALADACGAPLDTNRNGLVAEAEFLSFGFSFNEWDQDSDENLSPTEFHSCWRAMGWGESEPGFAAFDDDGDGAVEESEFFARDEFQAWDVDDDGVLKGTEWAQVAAGSPGRQAAPGART